MNVKLNIPNLVRQVLPNHKRKPGRLILLRSYVAPLAALFAQFDEWREQLRIEMNMTSQVGVLEGYLRAKYNDKRIRIETFQDRGLPVGLHFEGKVNAVPVSLGTTPAERLNPAVVPLPGELREQFGDVDFTVHLPADYSDAIIEKIRIDIERFKQVLVKYKIIEK